MINANELRAGNYFLAEDREILRVHAIKTLGEPMINNTHLAKDCDRIQLRPEILEKAGFKKDEKGQITLFMGYYCLKLHSGLLYLTDSEGNNIGMPKIYLDQLQNLYFFLTGEELEFKDWV